MKILALAVLCTSIFRAYCTDGPANCSWLEPAAPACRGVETPVLALVFIHMRKAGGTRVSSLISDWMESRKCFTSTIKVEEYKDPGSYMIGLEKGIRYPCPHLQVVENEYKFVATNGIIKNKFGLVMNKDKVAMRGSTLTSLRHPIDRIGSQAFFKTGVFDRSIFEKVVLRSVAAECGDAGEKAMQTRIFKNELIKSCVDNATATGMRKVKESPALWNQWMETKSFHDDYMPNYYIRRLLGGAFDDIDMGEIALQRPNMTTRLIRCNNRWDQCTYKALQRAIAFHPDIQWFQNKLDAAEYLQPTKDFLRDYVHVLISEELGSPRTEIVLQAAFMDNEFKLRDDARHNSGILHDRLRNIGGDESYYYGFRYKDVFPPAILKRLVRENKEDIELYHYARKLYFERTDAAVEALKLYKLRAIWDDIINNK